MGLAFSTHWRMEAKNMGEFMGPSPDDCRLYYCKKPFIESGDELCRGGDGFLREFGCQRGI